MRIKTGAVSKYSLIQLVLKARKRYSEEYFLLMIFLFPFYHFTDMNNKNIYSSFMVKLKKTKIILLSYSSFSSQSQ